MKKKLILISLVLVIEACTSHKSDIDQSEDETVDHVAEVNEDSSVQNESQTTNYKLDLNSIYHKFNHQKLDEYSPELFEEIGFNEPGYDSAFNKIYGDYSKQIFQEQWIHHSQDSIISDDFFFSIQDTTSYYGITVIGINEGFYKQIMYRTYDKTGKFIDEFELTGEGGDAEWRGKSYGNFHNDSIYERIEIETEYYDDSVYVDSVFTKILIKNKGEVDTLEIKKNKSIQHKASSMAG